MCQIIKEALVESIIKKLNESQEDMNYTHLAVNKVTNLIVNGWDYSGEDPEDLKQFKNDYFTVDLKDYGFNPKVYKIITTKFAAKNGISQWSNTGVFSLEEENKMKQEGKDFYAIANEQHPDWFVDDVNESKKHLTESKSPKNELEDALNNVLGIMHTYNDDQFGINKEDFDNLYEMISNITNKINNSYEYGPYEGEPYYFGQ